MTETIMLAVIAGIGAYVGSVYAFSHGERMKAPEATAQAYRDLLSAVGDLHRACADMRLAEGTGQPLDEVRAAWNRAGGNVSKIASSAGFLIRMSDLDIIDSVNASYRLSTGERVDALEKALTDLRNSANKIFSHK